MEWVGGEDNSILIGAHYCIESWTGETEIAGDRAYLLKSEKTPAHPEQPFLPHQNQPHPRGRRFEQKPRISPVWASVPQNNFNNFHFLCLPPNTVGLLPGKQQTTRAKVLKSQPG